MLEIEAPLWPASRSKEVRTWADLSFDLAECGCFLGPICEEISHHTDALLVEDTSNLTGSIVEQSTLPGVDTSDYTPGLLDTVAFVANPPWPGHTNRSLPDTAFSRVSFADDTVQALRGDWNSKNMLKNNVEPGPRKYVYKATSDMDLAVDNSPCQQHWETSSGPWPIGQPDPDRSASSGADSHLESGTTQSTSLHEHACLYLPCLLHAGLPISYNDFSDFPPSSRGRSPPHQSLPPTPSGHPGKSHHPPLMHIYSSKSSQTNLDFRSSGPVHGNEHVFDRYMQPQRQCERRKTRTKLSAEDKKRYAVRRHLGACPRHKAMKKKVSLPNPALTTAVPSADFQHQHGKSKGLRCHVSVPLSYSTSRLS